MATACYYGMGGATNGYYCIGGANCIWKLAGICCGGGGIIGACCMGSWKVAGYGAYCWGGGMAGAATSGWLIVAAGTGTNAAFCLLCLALGFFAATAGVCLTGSGAFGICMTSIVFSKDEKSANGFLGVLFCAAAALVYGYAVVVVKLRLSCLMCI